MSKYVIIGASAGGISAVEAIREVDPVGTIVVISDESFQQYSRPMIIDYLSGEATLEKLKYRDDQFWKINRVQALTGRKAVDLDLTHRQVGLDGGGKVNFEKLLIATGGKPFVPRIEGIEKEGVFTFTTFSDAEQLVAKIQEGKRAVVIGCGLIGVSVAEALVRHGVEVLMVELKDRILNLILDVEASEIVAKAIRKAGVSIVTGQTVKQILGKPEDDNAVGEIILTNNEKVPCDFVIVSIGVIPRTELVVGTKVKINKGIIVDRFMRTNVSDIYACGDVAEVYDFVLKESRTLPLWPVAHLGGRVAGYNMAGKQTEFLGGAAMSALKYFDIPAIAVGMTNPKEGDGYDILVTHDPARALYKKMVLKDGVLKGFIIINDIERAGLMFYLMRTCVNVGEFKEKLLSEDFGLVSLPEQLKKKMLMGDLT